MSNTVEQRTARPPTVVDVRTGLQRVLGAQFDAAWANLCSKIAVSPDVEQLDDAQFDRLLVDIADVDRLCRVLALSWKIRRTAARKLAELGR